MIVRQLNELEKTNSKIVDPNNNWDSTRMLLKKDNMGYSFHITTIYENADFEMHYQNHLETVYCISGEGEIKNLETGETFQILPGTVYALDQHDRHRLKAIKEMKMACVFNPPLIGNEVHNKEGAYELSAEEIK